MFAEAMRVSSPRHLPVLHYLVRELGNDKSKQEMAAYLEDLVTFNAETKLAEFTKVSGEGGEGGLPCMQTQNTLLYSTETL